MIKSLIKIANILDKNNCFNEADEIDNIIRLAQDSGWIFSETKKVMGGDKDIYKKLNPVTNMMEYQAVNAGEKPTDMIQEVAENSATKLQAVAPEQNQTISWGDKAYELFQAMK